MASTCCTTFFAFAIICMTITLVICQCNWSMDSYGYRNVKDSSNNGFLEWNLMHGPLPENEIGPMSGADDDCYLLARGGSDGFKALLLSPCYVTPPSISEDVSISWAIYSFGPNAANLNMYWRPGCLEPRDLPDEMGNVVVTLPGSIGKTWLTLSKTIKRDLMQVEMPFQIVFEAVMNGDRNSSVSLDNIKIRNAFSLTTANPAVTKTNMDEDSEAYTVSQAPSANNGSEQTNSTLNFCQKYHIVAGIDNCTFIGLMCAVIPLAVILVVWAVCRVYNLYFRSYEEPRRRKNRDYDAESMSRDMYASNSNIYMNSLTEHTTVFAPAIPDSVTSETSNQGKVSPSMPRKYEKKKEHSGDFLTVPKIVPGINVKQSVDGEKAEDQSYNAIANNVLQTVKDTDVNKADDCVVEDHAYNLLEPNGPSKNVNSIDVKESVGDGNEEHAYNIINPDELVEVTPGDCNQSGPQDNNPFRDVLNNPGATSEPLPESKPEVTDEVAHFYDIVNQETPPASPIDSNRSSSQKSRSSSHKSNILIEAYASVAVNDTAALIPSPTEKDPPRILHYADSFSGDRRKKNNYDLNPREDDMYEELNNGICGQESIAKEDVTQDSTSCRVDKSHVLYQTLVDEHGNENTFL